MVSILIHVKLDSAPDVGYVNCGLVVVLFSHVVSSRCVCSRRGVGSCGSCALSCLRMWRASFVWFLLGLLNVCVRDVF